MTGSVSGVGAPISTAAISPTTNTQSFNADTQGNTQSSSHAFKGAHHAKMSQAMELVLFNLLLDDLIEVEKHHHKVSA